MIKIIIKRFFKATKKKTIVEEEQNISKAKALKILRRMRQILRENKTPENIEK